MADKQLVDGVAPELRPVLAMILNALDRDVAEGKAIRGEMAQELRDVLAQPAQEVVQEEPFGYWRVPKDWPLQGMFLLYDKERSEVDIQNAIDHKFIVTRLYAGQQATEAPYDMQKVAFVEAVVKDAMRYRLIRQYHKNDEPKHGIPFALAWDREDGEVTGDNYRYMREGELDRVTLDVIASDPTKQAECDALFDQLYALVMK